MSGGISEMGDGIHGSTMSVDRRPSDGAFLFMLHFAEPMTFCPGDMLMVSVNSFAPLDGNREPVTLERIPKEVSA